VTARPDPAGLRVLALVTDAYGGGGGIAQFNRDLFGAMARSDLVREVVVLPRTGGPGPGPVPEDVRSLPPRAGKAGYGPFAPKAQGEGSGAEGQKGSEAVGQLGSDTVTQVANDSSMDSTKVDTATASLPAGQPAQPAPSASLPPGQPAQPSGPPGFLRIVGLPRGTTVMVDDQAPDSTPIRLNPGPHIVAISAPLYLFYVDTVDVVSAMELTLAPNLTPVGEPLRTQRGGTQTLGPVDTTTATCDRPGPGYNKDQLCWDTRAAPRAPPRVPVAGMTPSPGFVILLVKVNADGSTAEVATLRPSENVVFDDVAIRFAMAMRWIPARKDGQPVVSWTQVRLEPITP